MTIFVAVFVLDIEYFVIVVYSTEACSYQIQKDR